MPLPDPKKLEAADARRRREEAQKDARSAAAIEAQIKVNLPAIGKRLEELAEQAIRDAIRMGRHETTAFVIDLDQGGAYDIAYRNVYRSAIADLANAEQDHGYVIIDFEDTRTDPEGFEKPTRYLGMKITWR